MRSRFHFLTLLVGLMLSLTQCGGIGNLSKDIDVKFLPESPVVVNSELNFPDPRNPLETVTIKPPWFILNSRVYNGSNNILFLVTYELNGYTTLNGVKKSFKAVLDPSKLCDDRSYLAVLDPGDTYERLSTACDPYTPTNGGTGATRYETWYIGGLPESDTNVYSVDISAEGWFIDGDGVPVERLTAFGYVYTQ